ncbi:GNAT family N-acetyltransferase [Streptomyces jumonjinensis]|uniref:GNAT family N-acetyltransferase n=1 Tax=Streptomyces jumonjinensis TaxID=1945 RepID=A0A646KJL6_STRJU|nr:GNAT family N-acetyltransferase [Streptomyces jumonjinensis]MQT02268.1 GNAT family N-acetyltransferase [Streptomyces jumonjinensis]
MEIRASAVGIEPWSEDDFELLRAVNAPELMTHLGGPEPEEKLIARHRRYVDLSADRTGKGRMYRVVTADTGEKAGAVGFWDTLWRDQPVYETGWTILPEFHGRGLATAAALAVIAAARAKGGHRYLHAFPKAANLPSNGVCRKAGFELMGECDIEYPPGNPILAHDWRFDLRAIPHP